ncbi:hypothetical protein [Cetobacterium sp.]|uniref:hypothetical protein n=1 Tax=Cetobacterium sp. TaxID=2071632 RepID=UPI003EE78DF6
MRIRERFNIINSVNFDLLKIQYKSKVLNNATINVYEINENSKQELQKLFEIPELEKYKSKFKEKILDVTYTIFEYDKINTEIILLNKITETLLFFKDIFINTYPTLDNKSVSIKLPNSYDVIEIGEIYKKIGKSLNQIITKEPINGDVKLSNFDNGSLWIDIMLGTTAAVHVFGAIIWGASYCMKEYKKLKLIELDYERNNIAVANLEMIRTMNENLMKMYLEKEAENILQNHYEISGKEDPEFLSRMKNTIKEFSELIEKGAEVHPALEVANEIKHEFPDFKNLEFIESKIKQIENN